MQGAAARLAAHIRQAMKDQALSRRELAKRVGRLRGRPYAAQNVSRRLIADNDRPMIIVADEFWQYCQELSLDPAEIIYDSVLYGDRCPNCGSPRRHERWNLDAGAGVIVACNHHFHRHARCLSVTDGVTCDRPVMYVAKGRTDEEPGWHHVYRGTDNRHRPVLTPPSS